MINFLSIPSVDAKQISYLTVKISIFNASICHLEAFQGGFLNVIEIKFRFYWHSTPFSFFALSSFSKDFYSSKNKKCNQRHISWHMRDSRSDKKLKIIRQIRSSNQWGIVTCPKLIYFSFSLFFLQFHNVNFLQLLSFFFPFFCYMPTMEYSQCERKGRINKEWNLSKFLYSTQIALTLFFFPKKMLCAQKIFAIWK